MKKIVSICLFILVVISAVKLISFTQPPDKTCCQIDGYQNQNGDYVCYKIDGTAFAKLDEQAGYRYCDEIDASHDYFGNDDTIYVSFAFKNHSKLYFYVGNWTVENGEVVQSDHCNWQ
ncbi:MAG: hypothetical protein ACI4GY_00925 [Acutalibacteraceae bacterium]